jgi:hypothetical protein
MDKLDEIILSVLSDDGLCHRGKQKQAERRRKLRKAIDQYISGQLTGKVEISINPIYLGPDLIIDELQFNEQDK